MAYRKLGRDNKHRRSMLSTLTKEVIMKESITTTETRAKEARKFVEKMITYGKKGDLVSRRKALAFLNNDSKIVDKIFNDLAKQYDVETKYLNRQVKRNIDRFPDDFCFQLTKEEYYEILRCHFGTLELERGKYSKYLPYVFTETGVSMLSSVLHTDIAV